jgi:hypothetical protein
MKQKFPYPLKTGQGPDGQTVIGFTHRDMFIFDPTMSDCGRFKNDPSYYGLNWQETLLLAAANRLVEVSAEEALNAGCRLVQDTFGITDGGFAGVYFSGDEFRDQLQWQFAGYIAAQINHESME